MARERTREERLRTAATAARYLADELLAVQAPSLAADALALAKRIDEAPVRDAEVTSEFDIVPPAQAEKEPGA